MSDAGGFCGHSDNSADAPLRAMGGYRGMQRAAKASAREGGCRLLEEKTWAVLHQAANAGNNPLFRKTIALNFPQSLNPDPNPSGSS